MKLAFDAQNELAEHLGTCSACHREIDCSLYDKLAVVEEHARQKALALDAQSPGDGYVASVGKLEDDVDVILSFIKRNNFDTLDDEATAQAIDRAGLHLASFGRPCQRL